MVFMADIESMFPHFQVALEHRDYLRFFFCSKVMILPSLSLNTLLLSTFFDNSLTLAVANYGLRIVATKEVSHYGQETHDFI